MVFPDGFENKVGFDRIKGLLSTYCSGITGRELVDSLSFSDTFTEISSLVEQTWEMQLLLSSTDPVYVDNEWDVRELLSKIRVEGAYATEEELFNFKRHYDSLRSLLAYFRKSDQNICLQLKRVAAGVKYYPAVADQIDRILDRNGIIRDSASQKLKEIR